MGFLPWDIISKIRAIGEKNQRKLLMERLFNSLKEVEGKGKIFARKTECLKKILNFSISSWKAVENHTLSMTGMWIWKLRISMIRMSSPLEGNARTKSKWSAKRS
jgi:hypothetical protein